MSSSSEVFNFGVKPIPCHAWNHDRTQLAITPNSNVVDIYEKKGNKWNLIHKLEEHTLNVTGIDWAPKTNRIVTCGADRNAYVWQLKDNEWQQELVILRINRAATCVKWSPEEDKFAVGSSSRMISVCYFESENNWWVSKHIKKPIRSTIGTLSWHPNNVLLAAGSCDYTAYVFSAYIKEINQKPSATVWGKKMNFGNLMQEVKVPCTGWVNGVAFSPSGDKLAVVTAASMVGVVTGGQQIAVMRTPHLPFASCLWLTENSIVAGGHDCNPMMFTVDDSCTAVTFACKLDQKSKSSGAGKQVSAMNMFKMMDKKGAVSNDGDSVNTKHKNAILQVSKFSGDKFSTGGKDGNVIVWNFKSLEQQIDEMKIL